MAVFKENILRILDANLNRAIEGLRVAEEVARFILENTILQKRIKNTRHHFLTAGNNTFASIIAGMDRMNVILRARDSERDIGSRGISATEKKRKDLSSLIQSNCSRAAESARVFEEFSKQICSKYAAEWKRIRFEIYSIEQKLLSIAGRQLIKNSLKNIGLYCVIDRSFPFTKSPVKIASEMIKGGTRIIQYRDKESCDGEFYKTCIQISRICARSNVLFIINDRVDIARLVDADGVHLGQDDLFVSEARRILGPGKIIGKSCYTLREVISASKEDIDYVAVGALFSTGTKENVRIVGPAFISKTRRVVKDIPIIAIGGINEGNIRSVIQHKPDGICIISAIHKSSDISAAVRNFVEIITATAL
jgi:thiamine-phosphate pyrophosphorylase